MKGSNITDSKGRLVKVGYTHTPAEIHHALLDHWKQQAQSGSPKQTCVGSWKYLADKQKDPKDIVKTWFLKANKDEECYFTYNCADGHMVAVRLTKIGDDHAEIQYMDSQVYREHGKHIAKDKPKDGTVSDVQVCYKDKENQSSHRPPDNSFLDVYTALEDAGVKKVDVKYQGPHLVEMMKSSSSAIAYGNINILANHKIDGFKKTATVQLKSGNEVIHLYDPSATDLRSEIADTMEKKGGEDYAEAYLEAHTNQKNTSKDASHQSDLVSILQLSLKEQKNVLKELEKDNNLAFDEKEKQVKTIQEKSLLLHNELLDELKPHLADPQHKEEDRQAGTKIWEFKNSQGEVYATVTTRNSDNKIIAVKAVPGKGGATIVLDRVDDQGKFISGAVDVLWFDDQGQIIDFLESPDGKGESLLSQNVRDNFQKTIEKLEKQQSSAPVQQQSSAPVQQQSSVPVPPQQQTSVPVPPQQQNNQQNQQNNQQQQTPASVPQQSSVPVQQQQSSAPVQQQSSVPVPPQQQTSVPPQQQSSVPVPPQQQPQDAEEALDAILLQAQEASHQGRLLVKGAKDWEGLLNKQKKDLEKKTQSGIKKNEMLGVKFNQIEERIQFFEKKSQELKQEREKGRDELKQQLANVPQETTNSILKDKQDADQLRGYEEEKIVAGYKKMSEKIKKALKNLDYEFENGTIKEEHYTKEIKKYHDLLEESEEAIVGYFYNEELNQALFEKYQEESTSEASVQQNSLVNDQDLKEVEDLLSWGEENLETGQEERQIKKLEEKNQELQNQIAEKQKNIQTLKASISHAKVPASIQGFSRKVGTKNKTSSDKWDKKIDDNAVKIKENTKKTKNSLVALENIYQQNFSIKNLIQDQKTLISDLERESIEELHQMVRKGKHDACVSQDMRAQAQAEEAAKKQQSPSSRSAPNKLTAQQLGAVSHSIKPASPSKGPSSTVSGPSGTQTNLARPNKAPGQNNGPP